MNNTLVQILLYIIFITCIILIGNYYTNATNTITPNTKESFTVDQAALKINTTNELNNLQITNVNTQAKIYDYILLLSTILDKYKYIDAPISITNDGKICDAWGMYNNGAYKFNNNSCINIPGQQNRNCLSNNLLSSCSNYYDDDKIESLNNMKIDEIFTSTKYNIFLDINNLNSDISKKNTELTKNINDLVAKRNLEIQQLYFIDTNDINLDEKKKLLDKKNKDFDESENDVNINKIQFKQIAEQNTINDNNKNSYYNYCLILIVLIIIVGLLNFFFSELL
jgi:hypothetical protein